MLIALTISILEAILVILLMGWEPRELAIAFVVDVVELIAAVAKVRCAATFICYDDCYSVILLVFALPVTMLR